MSTIVGYHHIVRGDDETLTVYGPGETVVVNGDHPLFTDVLEAAKDGREFEDVRALADTSYAVAIKFEKLTERVSVANGRVYFDGDEFDNSLSAQVIRLLDEGEAYGDDGWIALVEFMENIAANPVEHSREQLYDWLRAHDFTIAPGGLIVGYKGVHSDGDGGYQSGFTGSAIRNGETVEGHIPNAVGDTIEMPRSAVEHNPSAACSSGLHVGTFQYAKSYAQGAMLRVLVNPRDVVSVPTDAGGEKVRVCRYVVDEIIDAPETAPYLAATATEIEGEDYSDESPENVFDRTYTSEIPRFAEVEFVDSGERRPAEVGENYILGENVYVCESERGEYAEDEIIARPVQHGDYVTGKGFLCYLGEGAGCGWDDEYAGPEDRDEFLQNHPEED